ncbi:hypothetical protein [Microbacterium aquimaris]|uniref:DNA-binding MarR family transcriptional regulator n=1 Tax=Microbacterium aquimaris TaxID=459816 RepID=A0ABU5N4L4_9MICO|nr:hypothetical protein [Microbacterium aquimaris]MDZ8160857.1 hypothetical protein [Microbacterium aquimaris]
MTTPETSRPIGFWLRALDAALTHEIDERLAAEGASRRDWTLLHTLDRSVDASNPPRRGPGRGRHLHHLADRGWIEQSSDGGWSLTEAGRDAKHRLGGLVDGVRTRVIDAVGEADYDTTVRSLAAMTSALGGDALDEPGPFGRGRFGRRFHGRRAPHGHHGCRDHADHEGDAGDEHGNRHHGFGPHDPGHDPRRTPAT